MLCWRIVVENSELTEIFFLKGQAKQAETKWICHQDICEEKLCYAMSLVLKVMSVFHILCTCVSGKCGTWKHANSEQPSATALLAN